MCELQFLQHLRFDLLNLSVTLRQTLLDFRLKQVFFLHGYTIRCKFGLLCTLIDQQVLFPRRSTPTVQ